MSGGRIPARRDLRALALALLGTGFCALAVLLAAGTTPTLQTLLPHGLPSPTPIDLGRLAEAEADTIAAALRRWVHEAQRLAGDPRWDREIAKPHIEDALVDAVGANAKAARFANVFLVDAAGRVRASLYRSRRVGQRLGGPTDPLARVVAAARGGRTPVQSVPVLEESRPTLLTAAPTAGGNVLVLLAGPQQWAELLEPSADAGDATIELMLFADGRWQRIGGDPREGLRLLRAPADPERDALLNRALAANPGIVRRSGTDGMVFEQTARNVPELGALVLISRPLQNERPAARLLSLLSRWALPVALLLLSIAAFAGALRRRAALQAPTPAAAGAHRIEPQLGEIALIGPDAPVPSAPPPEPRVAPLYAEPSASPPATPATHGRPRTARGDAAANAPATSAPSASASARPAPERGDAPTCLLTEVLATVVESWARGGGELVLRRGPGVGERLPADGPTLAALLSQLAALVGTGRPGMAVVIDIARGRTHAGLEICIGAPRDGQLPTPAAATLNAIADPPLGWDAAAMTVLDAAARCAQALGARLRASPDGSVLAVDTPFGPVAESMAAPARARYRGRRCLLVVDEELTAAVASEMLVRLGFDVHEQENLRTAIDELRRSTRSGARPCDLLIIDDRVPDAIELESQLTNAAMPRQPPVILLQARHAGDAPAPVTLALRRPLDETQLAAALAALPGLEAPAARTPAPSESSARGSPRGPTPTGSARVLDHETGLTRSGGDADRYRSLLADFARTHRGDARQFAVLLAAGRPSEARERLRALDTVAKQLAMPALARSTAAIDDALRAGRPVPPSRLHELSTTLAAAVAAAEAATAAPAPIDRAVVAAAPDAKDRGELWQRFDAALARGDVGALPLFEQLARGHQGAAWDALRDALLVLDFARAAEIRARLR